MELANDYGGPSAVLSIPEDRAGAAPLRHELNEAIPARSAEREAGRRLREQKELLDAIFENAPLNIGVFDSAGRSLRLNPAWRRAHEGRANETSRIEIRLSGGRTLVIGRNTGNGGEAETRFRSLFDSNAIAIMTANAHGGIIEANQAFLEMIGYTREDLAEGRVRWRDLTPPEYRRIDDERLLEAARVGRLPAIEKEYIRRDGSRVPVLVGGVRLETGTASAVCFVVELTERKRAERELEQSRDRLRTLAGHAERIREKERTRVAREIHDELGQLLTALKMDVQMMERLQLGAPGSTAMSLIRTMREHLDAGIGAVKRITAELRPAVLDHLGLAAAIEWQAKDFQARTGIVCSVNHAPDGAGADPEQATAIFRIFQEALTNVARHAGAGRVVVRLGRRPRRLWLRVADDGRGIDPGKIMDPDSLGLWGMRERVAALGGQFAIRRGPRSRGTILRVSIPTGRARRKEQKCES